MALAVAMAMTMLLSMAPAGAQAAGSSTWPSWVPAQMNGYFFWLGTDNYTGAAYDQTGTTAIVKAETVLLGGSLTGGSYTDYSAVTAAVYASFYAHEQTNPRFAAMTKGAAKVLAADPSLSSQTAGMRIAQFYQDVAILGFANTQDQLKADENFIYGNTGVYDPSNGDTLQAEDTATLRAVTGSNYTILDYYQYLLDMEGIGILECHHSLTDFSNVFGAGASGFGAAETWLENGMDWVGGAAYRVPGAPPSDPSLIDQIDGTPGQGVKDETLFTDLSQTWLTEDMGYAQYYADEVGDPNDTAEITVIKTFIRSRTHYDQVATMATLENPFEETITLYTNSPSLVGHIYVEPGVANAIPPIDVSSILNDTGTGNTGIVTADMTTNSGEMTVKPTGGGSAEITAYTGSATSDPDSWIYKAWVIVNVPGGPNYNPTTPTAVAAVTPVGTPPAGAMVWPYTLIKYSEEHFNFTQGVNYQFKATGGTPPYTWTFLPGVATKPGLFSWSAVPGAMPDGLSLGSDGVLNGSPQTLKSIGYWLLNLKVADTTGATSTMLAKVFIAAYPDILDDWAVNDIDQITVYGVANGFPDHMFWPKNDITRGEFAKWLVLSQGFKPMSDYSDLHQFVDYNTIAAEYAWDEPYLASAVAHGLMVGYSEYGNGTGPSALLPGKYITREEMAAMIGRTLTGVTPVDLDTAFVDGNQVHNWAHNFRLDVAIAAAKGIIKGFPDNHLNPLQDTLRDQAGAMIARWMGIADPNE